jgi:hypothetical protein
MIRQYKRTIPSGAVVNIDGMGQPEFVHFRECDDTSAVVSILATNVQGQDVIDAQLLSGQGFNGSKMFTHLALKNESDTQIVATFVVGSGEFTDQRINGQVEVATSQLLASPAPLLLNNEAGEIPANGARRQVVLYADANNIEPVFLGGVINQGLPIYPNSSMSIETTTAIAIYANETAAKIWYVET